MAADDLRPVDADDPAKPDCLMCQVGQHGDCLWESRPTSCACVCPWLEVDVTENFPSLRWSGR